MSKLADRIRKAARSEPQQLGFVTSRTEQSATMVLAARAPDAQSGASAAGAGADVVVVGGERQPAGGKAPEGGIAGAWIGGGASASAMKDAGYDFVVFNPDATPSTAVLEEQIGYVLALPADVTDVELRAIEGFQLDAIDVGMLDGGLTVRRQIDLRRIFALTRKPLMATVPADIGVDELQALRDTNVAVVAPASVDGVGKLRKTIDALPPRSRRKDDPERPTPLVPRAASGGDDDEDEE
jgi:hypothetical protein